MMRTTLLRISPGRRKHLKAGLCSAFLCLMLSGCVAQPYRTVSAATLQVTAAITLAGALDPQAVPLLARTEPLIIDLRTAGEAGVLADRQQLRAAGVQVIALPIGPQTLELSTVQQFEKLLDTRGERPVIVHCASGNRAGLLWAAHLLMQGSAIDQVQKVVAPVVTKNEARTAIADFGEHLNASQ